MADASMVEVMRFFGMKPPEFRKQWGELSDQDKKQLKAGIGNGSFTY